MIRKIGKIVPVVTNGTVWYRYIRPFNGKCSESRSVRYKLYIQFTSILASSASVHSSYSLIDKSKSGNDRVVKFSIYINYQDIRVLLSFKGRLRNDTQNIHLLSKYIEYCRNSRLHFLNWFSAMHFLELGNKISWSKHCTETICSEIGSWRKMVAVEEAVLQSEENGTKIAMVI